jgi:hypothetical protein
MNFFWILDWNWLTYTNFITSMETAMTPKIRRYYKEDNTALMSGAVWIKRPSNVMWSQSPTIWILTSEVVTHSLAVFMAKGNPLLVRVDIIIWRLLEVGLLYQWLKEHKRSMKRGMHGQEKYFVFAVSHLCAAFGCPILRPILSFFIFVCELLYHIVTCISD